MLSWLNQFTKLDPDIADAITDLHDLHKEMIKLFHKDYYIDQDGNFQHIKDFKTEKKNSSRVSIPLSNLPTQTKIIRNRLAVATTRKAQELTK